MNLPGRVLGKRPGGGAVKSWSNSRQESAPELYRGSNSLCKTFLGALLKGDVQPIFAD